MTSGEYNSDALEPDDPALFMPSEHAENPCEEASEPDGPVLPLNDAILTVETVILNHEEDVENAIDRKGRTGMALEDIVDDPGISYRLGQIQTAKEFLEMLKKRRGGPDTETPKE